MDDEQKKFFIESNKWIYYKDSVIDAYTGEVLYDKEPIDISGEDGK